MSPLKKQNSFEEKLKEQMDGMELKPSDALWSRIERNIQADSFEPKLQQKLDQYSVEPREEVWEQVASQLPENPKRRGILWFASVCTLLLATFGAGYWFSLSKHDRELAFNQNPEKAAIAQDENNTAIVTEKLEQTSSKKTQTNSLPTTTPSSQTIVNPESSASTKNNLQESQSKTDTKQADVLKVNQSGSNTKKQLKLGNNSNIAAKKGGNKNPGKPVNTNLAGVYHSNLSGGINNPIASEPSNLAAENSSINSIPAAEDSSASKQSNVATSDSKTTSSEQEAKGNSEPKVILESVNIAPTNPKDSFAENPIFRGNSYIAPEENFTNFSISAIAGAHITFMQLSMPSSSSYTGLQKAYDLRQELEKPALDFSGGLNLHYHFGKSWYVFSGIGISSFKQTVTFSVIPANQTNPPRIQPINLYTNPNDSIISGTGNSFENKYSFTEIPLWLGYQFPSEGKMHVELMGGVSYGRLNLVSAYMPDPGCIGMLTINDKTSFPNFKNVFFAGIAPALSFQINSSVVVGGMFSAKLALNSMVDNENWIQQRPASAGLNLFLRKRF